ncbi:MAG: phosphoribosyl-AMP cyclohydrolase / phosphoribosyl-ATP pyrophosphohydrolase, partial [Gemmatimonadales bacterium]|nr:phosphoribosyl-AMP cyclohydrolase / phosphoribosyl-ATP pyrophosphohydrolase [Gemmatimonadales bacterium]
MSENIRLSAVRFGADGLVPVVTQESRSGDVLMVAYANREALERTLSTGLAHYFSRSRGRLWQKGETSEHVQRITEVRLDCDGDAVLYRVEQTGPACHTGTRTCFSTVVSG